MFQNVEVEEEHVDERSVDDLLSFINGNDGGKLKILIFPFYVFTSCFSVYRLIKCVLFSFLIGEDFLFNVTRWP